MDGTKELTKPPKNKKKNWEIYIIMSTTVQIHPTPSKGQSDPGMVAFIPTNERASDRTQNNDDDFITTPERKTDRQRKKK